MEPCSDKIFIVQLKKNMRKEHERSCLRQEKIGREGGYRIEVCL